MHLLNLLVLVTPTLANVLLPAVTAAVTQPRQDSVFARAANATCVSSVLSVLNPPPSEVTPLPNVFAGPACDVTMTANLSSPFISYVSVIQTYLSTIESRAKAQTNCGEGAGLTFTLQCPTLSVFFTDAEASTTQTTSVTLPAVPTFVPIGSAFGRALPSMSLVFAAVLASLLWS